MKVDWLRLESTIRKQIKKYIIEKQDADKTIHYISDIIGIETGRGFEYEDSQREHRNGGEQECTK